jgi:hypothetical protein
VTSEPAKGDAHSVQVVAQPEHDSCPQCGSAEIGTSFRRSDSSGVAAWECHCSDCRLKWSEEP